MPTHDEALRAFELLAQLPGKPDTVNKPFSVLRAYIEQAKADADRLDALQNAKGNGQWIVAQGTGSFTVSLLRRDIESFATRKTIREAIDAARSAKPGETR